MAAFLCMMAMVPAAMAGEGCSESLGEHIPRHGGAGPTGSVFAQQVADLSGTDRDAAVEAALLAGDLPPFLRRLKPVVLEGHRAGGGSARVQLCVTPDYLAVGSDADYVRVPMGLRPALSIARRFGFVLPTTKMVDAIYAQADVRLVPQPLPAGPRMRSTDYLWRHNGMIHAQRRALGAPLGRLVAGHKKDLTLTARLRAMPQRVAIYGWQHPDGTPIQPLSTVHGARYADYSHGVRLVSATAYVDGEARSLYDILEDPDLAPIVSSEGPIRDLASLVATLGGPPADAPREEASMAR
ncbi:hypothetical protein GCM10022293_50500 [Azospirillum formosense]